MSMVLLAWELGMGTGHCVNLLPLAAELAERGHQVAFAARDLVTAQRVFSQVPVTLLQAPFLMGIGPSPIREPCSFAEIVHNTGFGTDDHVNVLADAWNGLYDLLQPSAVICEHAPHALLAAASKGIPRWVIGTGFFNPPDVTPLPLLRTDATPEAKAQAIHVEESVLGRTNAYLARYEQAPLERLSQLYAGANHQFILSLPELDHYPHRNLGENTTYVRPWSPGGGITPDWPPGLGPRVFGYLQPASRTWRVFDLLVFLAELRLSSLVHIPGEDGSLASRFANSTVRVVNQRVDISYVAQRAELAILNGNAGTATELLLAGIPQLNIPLHLEQVVFSDRIAAMGASLTARPDQPAQIAARLTTLLRSTTYRDEASRSAASHAACPQTSYSMMVDRIGDALPNLP